ncbi:MAG: pantoate--beta-alanine ligase [Bacteroidetes bacterium]|nr:pantoate--beta-alanine ligase [Bacteroidota bacterium]
MRIINTIIETQQFLKSQSGAQIGFVPTMGALHAGHMELVKRAVRENDISVCSIFVNPTQFNNPEDLKKYPRTLEEDCKMLEEVGCDVVFAPSAEEMYPNLPKMKLDFGDLETKLEGEFRPGHFNGVGIVVSKLFHIVKPQRAYFGQKDLQQCAVVNRLVKDLSFDLKLIICDTVREESGLAMSSRNRRLSETGRSQAAFLYQSLKLGEKLFKEGLTALEVKEKISRAYADRSYFTPEYYEIIDFETLNNIDLYKKGNKTAIVLAVFLEEVRLIDNIVF